MTLIGIKPDQVKAWVTRYFEYKEKKNGEMLICNPFDGDTKFHLGINAEKLCVNDWRGNGWAGFNPRTGERNKCTFLRFVQQYLSYKNGKCSFPEAVKDVTGSSSSAAAILAAGRARQAEEVKEKASLQLSAGYRELDPRNILPMDVPVWNYLRNKRKLSDQVILKHRVMSSVLDVLFPYYEYEELVYWQSRSILNKRFTFPPESVGVSKGEFLYGFDFVEPASYLAITEAIFCAMTLDEQTVAIGGAAITKEQVKKIKLLGPKDGIILAVDNDVAGLESIFANVAELSPFFSELYFSIPPSIPYTEDGVTKYTKDWNDIQSKTKELARSHFEANIRPLNMVTRMQLKQAIASLKTSKKALPFQQK